MRFSDLTFRFMRRTKIESGSYSCLAILICSDSFSVNEHAFLVPEEIHHVQPTI